MFLEPSELNDQCFNLWGIITWVEVDCEEKLGTEGLSIKDVLNIYVKWKLWSGGPKSSL